MVDVAPGVDKPVVVVVGDDVAGPRAVVVDDVGGDDGVGPAPSARPVEIGPSTPTSRTAAATDRATTPPHPRRGRVEARVLPPPGTGSTLVAGPRLPSIALRRGGTHRQKVRSQRGASTRMPAGTASAPYRVVFQSSRNSRGL